MGRCASRLCPCFTSASYGKYEFFNINGRSHTKSHDSKDNYNKTNGATNSADLIKSAGNNADISNDVTKSADISNDVTKSAGKDADISRKGDVMFLIVQSLRVVMFENILPLHVKIILHCLSLDAKFCQLV